MTQLRYRHSDSKQQLKVNQLHFTNPNPNQAGLTKSNASCHTTASALRATVQAQLAAARDGAGLRALTSALGYTVGGEVTLTLTLP